VETKFLAHFFLPSKNIEAEATIASFVHGVDKAVCEA